MVDYLIVYFIDYIYYNSILFFWTFYISTLSKKGQDEIFHLCKKSYIFGLKFLLSHK